MNRQVEERKGIRNRAGFQRIIKGLEGTPDLLSMPQVLVKFLARSNEDALNANEIEEHISRDPTATATVLRAASSTYFGVGTVRTLGQAITVLGTEQTVSLMMNLWFRQFVTQRRPQIDFDAFWEHSLAVAAAGRQLALTCCPRKAEEAYVAGLLHDIGILALERFSPETLTIAIDVSARRGLAFIEAERRVNGFDHAEVGGMLAEQWSLPDYCVNATRHHHEPRGDASTFIVTALVATADPIANRCGYAFMGTADAPFDAPSLKILRVTEEMIDEANKVMMETLLKNQIAS